MSKHWLELFGGLNRTCAVQDLMQPKWVRFGVVGIEKARVP